VTFEFIHGCAVQNLSEPAPLVDLQVSEGEFLYVRHMHAIIVSSVDNGAMRNTYWLPLRVSGPDFDRVGLRFVDVMNDKQYIGIRVFDVKTGEEIEDNFTPTFVRWTSFSRCGKYVISSHDDAVRVWRKASADNAWTVTYALADTGDIPIEARLIKFVRWETLCSYLSGTQREAFLPHVAH